MRLCELENAVRRLERRLEAYVIIDTALRRKYTVGRDAEVVAALDVVMSGGGDSMEVDAVRGVCRGDEPQVTFTGGHDAEDAVVYWRRNATAEQRQQAESLAEQAAIRASDRAEKGEA